MTLVESPRPSFANFKVALALALALALYSLSSQNRKSQNAIRRRQMGRSSVWFLASWNVSTLLDVDGPIPMAQQGNKLDAVDARKIDQVMAELVKYRVDVACFTGDKTIRT